MDGGTDNKDFEGTSRTSSDQRPSLSEVMREGRERMAQEARSREERAQEKRANQDGLEGPHEGRADSSSDDEGMMIAGLSEVALLMKKPEIVNGTALIWDERFSLPRNLWEPKYPEKPARVTSSFRRCTQLGLVDRCVHIEARPATEDQILLQHSQQQIDILQTAVTMETEQLKELSKQYDSVYIHQSTFEAALLAVGSTIEMMEQILTKKCRNGFALIRPPGHHAMTDEYNGFCLFNNVAIAAKHAVDNLGLQRVLIVDWDVHHGQGVQRMFYNDPRVLYFSIHRYEYGNYWPNLRESDYDYIGEGDGVGFNINVPLNQTGLGDEDYLAIFHQILMPVAYEFNPDLVLVSSGYDAAIGCPEGEMLVSPAAYAHFIYHLNALANGRLCVLLEGGYNIKSLSEGVALSLRSLLGDPCPLLKPTVEPTDSVTETILNVIKCIKPYWQCLAYQEALDPEDECVFPGVNEDPPRLGIDFSTPENQPKEYDLSYMYPYQDEETYWRTEEKWNTKIDALIAETSLYVAPNRTAYVYDAAMKAHRCLTMGGHPEKPERISRIYDKLVEWDLIPHCLKVASRLAEPEELEMVHSARHVQFMKETEEKQPLEMKRLESFFNSIYFSKETNICAKMAVGSTLNVVESVLTGQSRNGIAIVRPPGHHAECGRPMGFCFYNTVAIAARFAQRKYNVKRVLILDWDVHHGNGTQHMFYDDPSVLYISLHRYDNGFFFPSSDEANYDRVGQGQGEGFNVNIPWNYGGNGDAEYIAAFQQIVMPIAYEFAPELILVSAGFDAAIGDPLGGCTVTPTGYAHMTHMLSGLANGRVVLALEGGYNLVSIANCMATCTSVLLGYTLPTWKFDSPKLRAQETICNVLDAQKQYWKSLKCRVAIPVKERRQRNEPQRSRGDNSEDEDETTSMATKLEEMKVTELEGTPVTCTSSSSSETQLLKTPEFKMAEGAEGGSLKSNTDLLKQFEKQGVEQMYAVEPLKDCEHLEMVAPLPDAGLNVNDPCEDCQAVGENWVCLVCYKVYCSRYVKEHMVKHGTEADHPMVLSYADLSAWCYKCDNYIDNEKLMPAKKSAHKSKFGTEM